MTKPKTLTVLSYNIHKGFREGFRAGSKGFCLPEIRNLIRTTNADLVFLQEVVGENRNHAKRVSGWPEEAQYEFLADSVWTEHSYGRNAVYRSGHHGNAILSRYPIEKAENFDISTNRRECRGLLHAKIRVDDGSLLHACCTHLDLTKRGRSKQLETLCDSLSERIPASHALILAGDFNDWRKELSEPLEERLGLKEVVKSTHGKHKATFPSSLPVLSLDRVYVRGLKILEAQVLKGRSWKKLSDHVPVQARLQLKP